MKRIAIFASGTGTNAKKIIEHFEKNDEVEVVAIVSNKKTAPVLEIARENGIPSTVIDRSSFYDSDQLAKGLLAEKVDLIVLAGFLWLIPSSLLSTFPNKIINIHPALLPKYGGKGMYGMRVHKAVRQANERETGITIHFVNKKYDEGAIIFQEKCAVTKNDTAETIALKVRKLEHTHFPIVVEGLLLEQ